MFVQMEIVPFDHPNPMVLGPPAGAGRGAPAGRGGNAPPILASNAPDLPWIPSSTSQSGVRALMPAGNPVFNVVVLNDQTEWTDVARENIQRAVEEGKGFVVIHNALGDNQSWPWWREEVTGGSLVLKKSAVTPSATLDVRPVGNHPILQDIGALRLAREVAYRGMWQSPKITPLMEATGPATDKVVVWIGPHPKARVVCIQPGAASETHRNPAYRKLVRNAILWAGGRLS
jgi:hypothetical protein